MQPTHNARVVGPGIADVAGSFVTRAAGELLLDGLVKAAHHRRGLVGWVERAGVVREADTVVIWEEQP